MYDVFMYCCSEVVALLKTNKLAIYKVVAKL